MDTIKDFGFLVFILALVIGAFYGLLCLLGLAFIQGDYEDVDRVGDCFVITEYHVNWYPSSNEITNIEEVCK